MAVDSFRYPFIRSNNYLGAYRLPQGKAALPILESMEFEPIASGAAANFAGTASLAFAQSANLFAPSSMSGVATATFGQSGAIQAATSLVGNTALSFGQSGAATLPASFAGQGTLTFNQQGTFSAAQISAGANFAGSADLTFGQSASLQGATVFTGTATAAFGQSGALAAGAAFGGTAPITFGQSGNVFAPAAFGGNASIVFGQSGAFTTAVLPAAAFEGSVGFSFNANAEFNAAANKTESQFIGDGVYRGHERASDERQEQSRKIKDAIRQAYNKANGIDEGSGSETVASPISKPALRSIATTVAQQQDIKAANVSLERIKALIREYEQELLSLAIRQEDELMMVLLAA